MHGVRRERPESAIGSLLQALLDNAAGERTGPANDPGQPAADGCTANAVTRVRRPIQNSPHTTATPRLRTRSSERVKQRPAQKSRL